VRVERLTETWNIAVRWVHFPLHPETPPEGMDLSELFAGREEMLAAMRRRLQTLAAEEGLPYADRSRTYNSRLAQELGAWAETQEGGAAIHDILFRAYFADLEDISDPEVLVRLAAEVGVPPDEARQVLSERSFRDPVDRD